MDAEHILWLEEVCMKDLAEAIWGSWTPSSTAKDLNVPEHVMVEVGGLIVGCIATRLETDALRLLKLYLAPDARNLGTGANVLRVVVKRARSYARPVRLRVLVNNPAAQFYARHGFRIEAESSTHIYMVCDTLPPDIEELR